MESSQSGCVERIQVRGYQGLVRISVGLYNSWADLYNLEVYLVEEVIKLRGFISGRGVRL
jgi:hypothetical protein